MTDALGRHPVELEPGPDECLAHPLGASGDGADVDEHVRILAGPDGFAAGFPAVKGHHVGSDQRPGHPGFLRETHEIDPQLVIVVPRALGWRSSRQLPEESAGGPAHARVEMVQEIGGHDR